MFAPVQVFRFRCTEVHRNCTLENWNPEEEGFYVLAHVPAEGWYQLHLVNVTATTLDARFWQSIVHTADIRIVNSVAVQRLFVPSNCTIRRLTIERTRLSTVKFEENFNLDALIINRSDLRDIMPGLMVLPRLTELLIRASRIDKLVLNLFCLQYELLEYLNLDENRIHTITEVDTYGVCQSRLRQLFVRHNKLQRVNLDWFAPYRHLTELNLSFNKIQYFTGSLSNAALTHIGFSGNRLRELDFCHWHSVLPNVVELSVAHNNLTQVPGCLQTLPNVSMLYLQGNQISALPFGAITGLAMLRVLHLGSNKLSSIAFDAGLLPPSLAQLHLYRNCLCRLNISDAQLQAMANLTIYLNKMSGNKLVNEETDCQRC